MAGGLSTGTCQRMVEAVDDSWTVRSHSAADTGFADVYFVTVETPNGPRECVLKVSDDIDELVRAEARLTRLIDAASSVPVPAVLGRVDEHPDLPAPFFLAERLSGEHPDEPPSGLPLADLTALARQVGRHLCELHTLDAFDRFGLIYATADADSTAGARPLAREHDLALAGGRDSWADWLRELASWHLDDHADTRFSDRTATIRDAVETGVDDIDRAPEAVIGRVDHAAENLLVEPGTSAVTGAIDWGMCRTVAPGYDLACAELTYAGLCPLDADRRERVRAALYDGYETHRPVDVTPVERRLYLLVHFTAWQTWLADWVSPSNVETVEATYRTFLDDLLAA